MASASVATTPMADRFIAFSRETVKSQDCC
jgi:hypothetical protein